MPEISRFLGIIIRMFYDDHNPPHIHAEYSGNKALLDFYGNIIRGSLESRTALRLTREWIEMRRKELNADWERARSGEKLEKIDPLP
mgnify:CR=1 FL=1